MEPIRKQRFSTVEEYLSAHQKKERALMESLRKAIRQAVPGAEEGISYNMPAFRYYGILAYFAAHREHIGFYPGTESINRVFKEELKNYYTSKGTIRFPYDRKLPLQLIKKIAAWKAKANLEKAQARRKRKK